MSDRTMRAVTINEFGGPDVLTTGRIARPEPLPTEVLVRVHAAGINPVDWKTRAGHGMAGLQTLPLILGWDVSGVVEEVGFGVTTLAPGDEVYAMPWFPRPAGAYAEFVTAPSRQFARKPDSLSHVEAAALPLAALTAWQALVDTARVTAGQRVLVHAAAGGVGHLAVQIAKHLGAEVIATAREPRHAWLKELGADETIDYTHAAVRGSHGRRGRRHRPDRRRGRHRRAIGVGHPPGRPGRLHPQRCLGRPRRRCPAEECAHQPPPGRAGRRRPRGHRPPGRIRRTPGRGRTRLPLEQAADAHRLGETNRTRGKLVLDLAQ